MMDRSTEKWHNRITAASVVRHLRDDQLKPEEQAPVDELRDVLRDVERVHEELGEVDEEHRDQPPQVERQGLP